MAAQPEYPFEPKSNAYLRPGQFWGLPLSDGRWACGRVLGLPTEGDPYFPGGTRAFLAGLMDWIGNVEPDADSIGGHAVVAQGWAHVKTIRLNGGCILGERPLEADAIRGLREVTHRGGGTVMLYEGATPLRPATRQEAVSMPVCSTWGLRVVSVLAERLFVQGLPLTKDEG